MSQKIDALKAAGDVAGLSRLLDSRKTEEMGEAAEALVSLGAAAVPALLSAAKSPKSSVRMAAALALDSIAPQMYAGALDEVIAALVGLLGDRDAIVGVVASDSLAKLGPAALSQLTAVLQGSGSSAERAGAAEVLGKIGDPAAVAALRAAAAEGSPLVRRACEEALVRLAEPGPAENADGLVAAPAAPGAPTGTNDDLAAGPEAEGSLPSASAGGPGPVQNLSIIVAHGKVERDGERWVFRTGGFSERTISMTPQALRFAYLFLPQQFKWRAILPSQTRYRYLNLDSLSDDEYAELESELARQYQTLDGFFKFVLADLEGRVVIASWKAFREGGIDPIEALGRTRAERQGSRDRWLKTNPSVVPPGSRGALASAISMNAAGASSGSRFIPWESVEHIELAEAYSLLLSTVCFVKFIAKKDSRLRGIRTAISPKHAEACFAETDFWRSLGRTQVWATAPVQAATANVPARGGSQPGAPPAPPETSRMAIASLATGIATWIILPLVGAIAAIVTGHLAKKQIRQNPNRLTGAGIATAGMTLGYAQLGIGLLIAIVTGIAAIASRTASPMATLSPRATAAPVRLAATAVAAPTNAGAAAAVRCSVQDGKWTGTLGFSLSGCVITDPMLTLITSKGDQVQVYFYYLNDEIRIENGRLSYRKARDGGQVTIEGAFTSPTEASGTWVLTKGTKIAGGTATVTQDTTGSWTASLGPPQAATAAEVSRASTAAPLVAPTRTPTRTPTRIPTATATPRPSPTASPTTAPTLEAAAPVSLGEALDKKLADIQILGMGGASGASIQIIANATGSRSVSIEIAPGTVLRSSVPGEQDMVVRRLLGLRQGEQRYSPTEVIFLPGLAAGPQSYVVDAYCLNFHKGNPSATTSMAVDAGSLVSPAVAAVLAAAARVPGAEQDIDAIQAAVWTVTDHPTWQEMADRGYSPERQMVAALLQSARLDQECAQLFGQACTVPDCLQSNPTGLGGTRSGPCVSRVWQPDAATPAPAPMPTTAVVATTTVLDTQVLKLFAPGPDTAGIAVTRDAIWVADGEQKRIHHLDRSGAPVGSFQVKAQGEFRGLAWDGEALRLLVHDYQLGSQVIRLDVQGKVLSTFTVPADLRDLTWNAVDESFWTIVSGSDGFLLELGAGGELRQTLNVPVFGSMESLAWAPDGLWMLSGFGKWHRFSFDGEYLASAELPMEVFAKDPALAWDGDGFLWVSVADTREIYQFALRQAAVDVELPSELRSSSEAGVEGQLPLPRPSFRALPGSTNAILHVANGLSAPLIVALDSTSGGDVHQSAAAAPGETWSAAIAKGGAFTLFVGANAAEPVAYYGKILLLAGYEYTWVIGDAVTITPPPAATATPSVPLASATAVPPTAAPTARGAAPPTAAPTRAATQPKPATAPAAACADSRARITYPANGAAISGVTNFLGTANLPDQAYYKFEYKPASSPTWQYLTQVDGKTVINDKLMDFFTTTIAPGVYDFRLIAVDRSGNYPSPCEIRLTVQR